MESAPRRKYGWGKAIRLRKHAQFSRIQSRGRRMGGKFLIVIFAPSSFVHVRHGLTVSKRVGNAVTRNKVKRRLRDILRHKEMQLGGFDFVWIAKTSAASAAYHELARDVDLLFERLGRSCSCPHT